MKKLIILLILFTLSFTIQASQNIVDDFGRKIYNSLKDGDFALFQSLYINSYEVKALIDNGFLHIHVKDITVENIIEYFRSEKYTDLKKENFSPSFQNVIYPISSETIFSSVEVEQKENVRMEALYYRICRDQRSSIEPPRKELDIYSIVINYLDNGRKAYIHFNAILLPSNLTPSSSERLVLY